MEAAMSSVPAGTAPSQRRRELVNFGGNVTWQARCYRPRNEQEVLQILGRHRSERVRAIGSLHSWSDIAVTPGVTLDMSELDAVRFGRDDGRARVVVGAGCTLARLLDSLHATTSRTLPTLGVIKRQTLSGLVSTGTHGSGRPSVSHFVTAVRIAAFGADGTPTVFEDREGDELRAARCALGCMGVILSMELRTVPKFRVRETVLRLARVSDALQLYAAYPLTQFALVPHTWKVIAWQRETVAGTGIASLRARVFRVFNVIGVDIGFHLLLKASIAIGTVKGLMKLLPHLLIANAPRVDDAEHVLTQLHHLFRHEEMELFVPESKVADAAELLRYAIAMFAGDTASTPTDAESKLRAAGLYDELLVGRGTYLHHYPVLFRRVLPDDTLMSMAGAASEPWFSFSLFTYARPGGRAGYYTVCSWLARAMHALFGARLHWGKHYPLGAADTERMYPDLPKFTRLCRDRDPGGVFRNEFADRVLGFR
jgi:hypothetical protein